MAAEKYGCFVEAKTARYMSFVFNFVFIRFKLVKTELKDSCLKVSKLIYNADVF